MITVFIALFNNFMKQLFTFNSQQFSTNLKKPQPKPIVLSSQDQPSIPAQKNNNIFRSKKRMKRYEQILQMATRNRPKQVIEAKHLPKNELKSFIIGQLNHINLNIAPLTMKLVEKPQVDVLKGKKRCHTDTNKEENMLFTFYPKQKHSQQEKDSFNVQQLPTKKLQIRSFSLKNSPIVDYPHSNKILPRVFRIKTQGDNCHLKRESQLSLGNNQIRMGHLEDSLTLKESNRERKRNFSIKGKIQNDININVQKLHKPILQALSKHHQNTREEDRQLLS